MFVLLISFAVSRVPQAERKRGSKGLWVAAKEPLYTRYHASYCALVGLLDHAPVYPSPPPASAGAATANTANAAASATSDPPPAGADRGDASTNVAGLGGAAQLKEGTELFPEGFFPVPLAFLVGLQVRRRELRRRDGWWVLMVWWSTVDRKAVLWIER
jgi:hypothetical protein